VVSEALTLMLNEMLEIRRRYTVHEGGSV